MPGSEKDKNEHLIGQLNESSLHNQIKNILAEEGDLIESKIGRYFIDIVKPDHLVEIQTKNFSSFKSKLENLIEDHKITVAYPIAWQKQIVYLEENSEKEISRRKSPQKRRLINVFEELMRIPALFKHPNFTLQVLLIKLDEFRVRDGKGSWRRKGVSIVNRKLVEIDDIIVLETPTDLLGLLPFSKNQTFTSNELAKKTKINKSLARKMCYTLKKMSAIEQIGKDGNAFIYQICEKL